MVEEAEYGESVWREFATGQHQDDDVQYLPTEENSNRDALSSKMQEAAEQSYGADISESIYQSRRSKPTIESRNEEKMAHRSLPHIDQRLRKAGLVRAASNDPVNWTRFMPQSLVRASSDLQDGTELDPAQHFHSVQNINVKLTADLKSESRDRFKQYQLDK